LTAVLAFYVLDFSLNAVQATCRALILDVPPLWQQQIANAWAARLSNIAMVVGYFTGFVDLVKFVPFLGDSQVKVFCISAIIVFIITLAITCLTTKEKVYVQEQEQDGYVIFFHCYTMIMYVYYNYSIDHGIMLLPTFGGLLYTFPIVCNAFAMFSFSHGLAGSLSCSTGKCNEWSRYIYDPQIN
jgi:hypothetical protein